MRKALVYLWYWLEIEVEDEFNDIKEWDIFKVWDAKFKLIKFLDDEENNN